MWNNIKELYDSMSPELRTSLVNMVKYYADDAKQDHINDILEKNYQNVMDIPYDDNGLTKRRQAHTYSKNMSPIWEKIFKSMTDYLHSPTFKSDHDKVYDYWLNRYKEENPEWWRSAPEEGIEKEIYKLNDLLKAGGIDVPEDYQYDNTAQNIASAVQGVI